MGLIQPPPRRWLVAGLVVGGLVGCALINLWIEMPTGGLPGVALGSETILAVERTLGLFAAWLLVLIAVAQGWEGQLPTEISSRGLMYASDKEVQDAVEAVELALQSVNEEVDALRRDLMEPIPYNANWHR